VAVLLQVTDARLRRVGSRLFNGDQFPVTIPERSIQNHRPWRIVLVIANTDMLKWEGDALEFDVGGPVSVIAVARLRGSGRPSTTDDRVIVADSQLLPPRRQITNYGWSTGA